MQEPFKEFKPLAERGDQEIQGYLAAMYLTRKGVPKDDTQAKYSALAPSYIATKLSSTELKDAERISTQLQNSRNFGIDLRKFLDSHQ